MKKRNIKIIIIGLMSVSMLAIFTMSSDIELKQDKNINRYASASINSSDNNNSSDSNSITPKDIEQGVS